MKKFGIGLSMLFILMGLFAQTSIKAIRAEDYQSVVCRLVLDLNIDAQFTVQQKADGLQIEIENFDGKDARRQINSSLIREVKITPKGLWIGTIKGLRYEQMRLSESKQAVIDLFSKPDGLSESLAIATFYSDRGKYVSADDAFYALDGDYPNNDEIIFHWGLLLKRRGSSRANDKLRQIPQSSSYYEAAQELIQGGKYIPIPDSVTILQDSLDEIALRDSIYKADSLIVAVPKLAIHHPKPKLLDVITELASRHFFLTLLIFVSTLVIISILIFGPKQRSAKPVKPIENHLGFEAMALRRMVHRLLADGWTHKETARELKIGINEVAQIADRSQSNPEPEQPDEI